MKRPKPTRHPIPLAGSGFVAVLLLLLLLLLLPLYLLLLPSPSASLRRPDSTSLRVYVYDLPDRFNARWLSNPRCATHLFAAEVALHRAILRSAARTLDPAQAHLFLVPVYVSCNFSTPNGFPSLAHARPLLAAAVAHVASLHPFWNRSAGADHVFVATHDHGACFHAIEAAALGDGVPGFLRNSVILQTFGVARPHPCQPRRHVVIPPYVSPDGELLRLDPAAQRRDIFAFFRGKMEVRPKNVSGHLYGNGVRTEIWRRYGRDRRFRLGRKRDGGYRKEMARSMFCLCPRGWAPWSPRLVEAVALGCVPVLVADGIRLPFPETVPWPEISLSIPEAEIANMGRVLGHVAATNLSAIQSRLWRPEIRRALLYHPSVQRGDATWHVLAALARMVGSGTVIAE